MLQLREAVRQRARPAAALALCLVAWGLAVPREPGADERRALASRFAFREHLLDAFPELPRAYTRRVHPSLEHIAGWISSVGAAMALSDLDQDGLPNDLCYVDPRIDSVIVAPVPGTPQRYEAFALRPDASSRDATTAPMGCVPVDLDEDGWMDVVVYYWGRTPVVFLNKGTPIRRAALDLGPASFVSRTLVPGDERWFTNALCATDLDGDGHLDLVVGNYFPDGARVLDPDGDRPQEMQESMSRAYNGGENRILRWAGARAGAEPDVEMEEVPFSLPERERTMWTLALGTADLDGDARPELYVANDFGPDQLFHNRSEPGRIELALVHGRRSFTIPRSKVLGRDSFKGMGVDFADLNGDGWFDIHVGNITTEFGLEESGLLFLSTGETTAFAEGRAPYVEGSEVLGLARSGWTWDVRFGDFDNDGTPEVLHATGFLRGAENRWPELHEAAMGNDQLLRYPRMWHRFAEGDDLSGHSHDYFFVRRSGGGFVDLAREVGLAAPSVSRAIATADVDADGRLDYAVGRQWEASAFFHNEAPAPGAFLGLHLLFPAAAQEEPVLVAPGPPPPGQRSRPAVGAVARIRLPDGSRRVAQVAANGHSGVSAPEIHFGLGSAGENTRIAVEITWRAAGASVERAELELAPGWHTLWLRSLSR